MSRMQNQKVSVMARKALSLRNTRTRARTPTAVSLVENSDYSPALITPSGKCSRSPQHTHSSSFICFRHVVPLVFEPSSRRPVATHIPISPGRPWLLWGRECVSGTWHRDMTGLLKELIFFRLCVLYGVYNF